VAVKNVVKSLGFLHPLSTNDLHTFLPLVEPQFVNFQDFRKRDAQGVGNGDESKDAEDG